MFSEAAVLTMLDVGQPPRQLGGIEIEINADDAPVDHPHAVRPGVHIHLRPLPGGVRAGPAASVRAMMTMSRLTFFAAATLAAMSRARTRFLPFRCPHFLGRIWSSRWTAPAPASSEGADHVHDVQHLAVAGIAIDQQQARRPHDLADEEGATLSTVITPRSGRPIEAVMAAPDRYRPSKPACFAWIAAWPL